VERFFFALEGITYIIYNSVNELPPKWNDVAQSNVFLQSHYLQVLEESAPVNMQCFYIGIFENKELIGVSLAQYLDLNKLESFGERDKCFKTAIRNFVFKNFASHVLFLGNNMITGQNGYAFSKKIDFKYISAILIQSAEEITTYFKNKGIKIHLVSFKDFYEECSIELRKHQFSELYEFNAQPNMVFYLDDNWKNTSDYVGAFSKKYRDQYKRAHKKFDGIVVQNLNLNQIIEHEKTVYDLYHYVAKNAPFNTFFLSEKHFSTMKSQCLDQFQLFGYFLDGKLVGFHTLLLNGTVLETYFLGYDSEVQKENMLYLNMLYNMTEYGIENGFKKIIFGRTALEIKSSIGAVPVKMSGFLYHRNKLINKYIDKIFPKLEPEMEWQQRHPFN
jgi:predicted N-acyltransferase